MTSYLIGPGPRRRPDPPTLDGQTGDAMVPLKQVAREFGVTRRTVGKWMQDSTVGFPPAVVIRGRGYVTRSQLEAFKRTAGRSAC
jgi:hypothetical protein